MCATLYDAGGSLNVIFGSARGASSDFGMTRFGCLNVFVAFRSPPVSVSQARTRLGNGSRQSSVNSCGESKSRLTMDFEARAALSSTMISGIEISHFNIIRHKIRPAVDSANLVLGEFGN
jgi:hypothetical protein